MQEKDYTHQQTRNTKSKLEKPDVVKYENNSETAILYMTIERLRDFPQRTFKRYVLPFYKLTTERMFFFFFLYFTKTHNHQQGLKENVVFN